MLAVSLASTTVEQACIRTYVRHTVSQPPERPSLAASFTRRHLELGSHRLGPDVSPDITIQLPRHHPGPEVRTWIYLRAMRTVAGQPCNACGDPARESCACCSSCDCILLLSRLQSNKKRCASQPRTAQSHSPTWIQLRSVATAARSIA